MPGGRCTKLADSVNLLSLTGGFLFLHLKKKKQFQSCRTLKPVANILIIILRVLVHDTMFECKSHKEFGVCSGRLNSL
jgi:hypothetical protein